MPKIEDWVVGKVHDDEQDKGDIVKHPEGFGISNAGADDHLCGGRSETIVNREDGAALHVSDVWKLMKQQLQSMPPGNQLMILVSSYLRCRSFSLNFHSSTTILIRPITVQLLCRCTCYPHSGVSLSLHVLHDIQTGNMRVWKKCPPYRSHQLFRSSRGNFVKKVLRLPVSSVPVYNCRLHSLS